MSARGRRRGEVDARPRAGLPAARVLVAALAALALAGCAIFPQGAYWPSYAPEAHGRTLVAPAVAPSPLPGPAMREQLQANVARRWRDDDLAEAARAMEPGPARWVYADALRAVAWFYVDPVSYRDLVVSGLVSLRSALDTPAFQTRFPTAADSEGRARFAEAVDILALKAGAARPWCAWQAADWLDVALEKNRAMLGLPDGAVVGEMLFGAMDSLDPYTRFLTPAMVERHRQRMRGNYTGLGIALGLRDGQWVIVQVYEGGPAARAGVQAGDALLAVDGRPLPAELEAVLDLLRGQKGATVTLTVRTGDAPPRDLAIERGEVHLPAVRRSRVLEDAPTVGYVRLEEFTDGVARDLRQALGELREAGAEAVVLDLRGNPGGSLFGAVGCAGALIEDGLVARTRGRVFGATWTYDVPFFASPAWWGPLAVLVDGETASAAEVLAAALQRHGRATIVGRRTFGKGAAQVHVPTGGGTSAVSVTVARVYDPDGVCLEGAGVEPDVAVSAEAEAAGTDAALRAAVEALVAGRAAAAAR